jgi:hypothetical protein
MTATLAGPLSGGRPDYSAGGDMHRLSGSNVPEYEKPRLDKFGTFRELTRSGGAAFNDIFLTDSNDGCALTSSTLTCYKP